MSDQSLGSVIDLVGRYFDEFNISPDDYLRLIDFLNYIIHRLQINDAEVDERGLLLLPQPCHCGTCLLYPCFNVEIDAGKLYMYMLIAGNNIQYRAVEVDFDFDSIIDSLQNYTPCYYKRLVDCAMANTAATDTDSILVY